MRRTRLSLVVAGVVALCVATAAGASNPSHYLPGGAQENITPQVMPAGASNATLTYILQLSGDPVTVADAKSKDAGNGPLSGSQKQQLISQLKQQQSPVIQAAQQVGATLIASFQTVYNGIAVTIPARQAWQLSTISGVTGVFQAHTFTPAAAAPGDGLPLINVPQAWDGTNGFHGEGLKVGDIDTGIDYTHADFGGSGNPMDYQSALATDTAAPNPLFIGPTSETNIKGGIDLVGDNYDASSPDPAKQTPQPDPNPLDCNSHGTHTAGTIAGQGVLQDGSTFTGPYNANTINSTSFQVPPGVAPKASLYAIRVFGCSGSVSDAVLLEAMDWAVNNGMDVINMSLGAPFGSASDPDSQAATNTANDGVIVVSASGNNGNGPYITSSPGAGTGGLAVAAVDSTQSFPAADIGLAGGTIKAINANGATFSDGTTLPVKVLHDPSQPHGISLGCNENDYTSAGVSGDLVVVQRGTCARVARAIFGQEAGAAAVLMVNNANSFPPFEGKITEDPDNGFKFNVTIPFLGVPSSQATTLLAADGTSATLTNDTIANPSYKQLAGFSSFGPSSEGSGKPEVAAPGVSIASAGMGTGTGALIDSGTSMATPHTSGTAALVKQADPSWGKVAYWKAAIVDTASPAGVVGYSSRGAGAGLIQANLATETKVVATVGPTNESSVNFGIPESDKAFTGGAVITLHNFGGSPATFNVSDSLDQGDAHSVSFDTSTVTVPAGGTSNVHIQVSVPSGGADPATSFNDWFGAAQFDDLAGLVLFTPASSSDNSGVALNVPYYGVPTLVSNTTVNLDTMQFTGKSGSNTVNATVTNKSGATGFADWFSWGASSSQVSKKGGNLGAADLLNVGLQTIPGANFGIFALNVSHPWTNPAEEEFDVLVDVNGDGNPDYDVVAVDFGGLTTGSANGEDVVAVISLATGRASIHYLAGAYFNGTTLELPFDFSQLCQSGTPCISSSTPITYQVFSFDRNGGSDSTGVAAPFNLFHPVFSNNLEDVVPAGQTATDPTTVDTTQWAATPQLGFLVLEQNNQGASGKNEAATIPLSFTGKH